MAVTSLFITEFAYLAPTSTTGNDAAQAPVAPGLAEQVLAISGSSNASAAFNAATKFIMVNTDTACNLAFSAPGATPTAVTTAHRMAANETRFYGVFPTGKVAVIANS